VTTQLIPGLDAWREPAEFMDLEADEDGLNPIHLNCLNHCLREVLRGHGVASPLRMLARPLGLQLSVDKTLRIWLLSRAEHEWDAPAYNGGLVARWLPVREHDFLPILRSIVDSGRVGVVRATRWRVPWLSQTALAPSDWHASVLCALDGDRIRVVDRQFAGTTTAARDLTVEAAAFADTARGGMAFLDYRLEPTGEDDEELVRRLVAESAENLSTTPAFPGAGNSFGTDALDQLETLLSPDCFGEVDSRQLRVTLRWHLPSCVRKFVVGNRTVLGLAIRRFADRPENYAEVLARLESDCVAWDDFARATALAARAADKGIPDTFRAALDRVRDEERLLREALSEAASEAPCRAS
jgi:hypothetical protein